MEIAQRARIGKKKGKKNKRSLSLNKPSIGLFLGCRQNNINLAALNGLREFIRNSDIIPYLFPRL